MEWQESVQDAFTGISTKVISNNEMIEAHVTRNKGDTETASVCVLSVEVRMLVIT